MSAVAIGAAVIGAGASLYSSNKAQQAVKDAANSSKVDINALDEQTRAIAKRNALDSAALEAQLSPEVPQLRTQANQAVLNSLGGNTLQNLQSSIASGNGALNTPLLRAAIEKASQNLELGGKLGVDQQNLVTRQGLAKAGGVAQGNLGLGRDVVARDLGLSSLDLENSRLAAAGQFGQMEQGLGQANEGNFLNRAQLIAQLQGTQFGQGLGAAQYGNSIQQPLVGLDPSSVANIAIGNQSNTSRALANQANISGQQSNNYMQFAGNLLGNGIQGYTSGKPSVFSSFGSSSTPYSTQGGGSGYSPAPYNFGAK